MFKDFIESFLLNLMLKPTISFQPINHLEMNNDIELNSNLQWMSSISSLSLVNNNIKLENLFQDLSSSYLK